MPELMEPLSSGTQGHMCGGQGDRRRASFPCLTLALLTLYIGQTVAHGTLWLLGMFKKWLQGLERWLRPGGETFISCGLQ